MNTTQLTDTSAAETDTIHVETGTLQLDADSVQIIDDTLPDSIISRADSVYKDSASVDSLQAKDTRYIQIDTLSSFNDKEPPGAYSQIRKYQPEVSPDFAYQDSSLNKLQDQVILKNFQKEVKDSFAYAWESEPIFQPGRKNGHDHAERYTNYLQSSQEPSSNRLEDGFVMADWFTGLIFISLLVFIWGRIRFKKYVELILKAPLNYTISMGLLHDNNSNLMKLSFIFNLVFAFNTSLFITQIMHFYHVNPLSYHQLTYFVLLLLLIPLVYPLTKAIIIMLGYLFNGEKMSKEYTHQFYILNKNLGIYYFPLLVLMNYLLQPYKEMVIFAGIILFFLVYFLRIIRGLQIILHHRISIFYTILYLCTLEIIPIMLIIKLVRSVIE